MQKSQVFFVEFRKYCVEVPNNQCCGDLRAIELAYECPETGFFCGNFVAVAKFRKNPVSLAIVRKSWRAQAQKPGFSDIFRIPTRFDAETRFLNSDVNQGRSNLRTGGQKPGFSENTRYKPQKSQKPGFFDFDA